jgi:hypothetical protein
MDSIPPSYLQATNRDPWTIISSFVPSQDLCSAALVSQKWNLIFAPHLWGNPASHFGTEHDAVYVALVRFKRTLSWARLSTRELTHTLRLPPAHAELYDGPRPEWLRDLLQRLPRLQSLIVYAYSPIEYLKLTGCRSGLPFFDHWALMNLRVQSLAEATVPPSSLRLLEAVSCSNATSSGLREALHRFNSLTYLDLSRTPPAKDPKVLEALQYLPKLQILKLQGLGLKDDDINLVARAVGLRVRSLDVRDNRMTDRGLRAILQNCIMTSQRAIDVTRANMIQSGHLTQSMQEYYGVEIQEVYKTNFQDRSIYNRLTSGFFHHLGIEDTIQTGITHLYISGNDISVNAVADLLRMQRLHVLDVGNINMAVRQKTLFQQTKHGNVGAECLIPLVEQNAELLTYLRIHHTIVTNCISVETPEIAELDGGFSPAEDREQPSQPQELAGDAPRVQELPTSTEVFELEGSPVAVHHKPDSEPSPVGSRENSSMPSANSSTRPSFDAMSRPSLENNARFSFEVTAGPSDFTPVTPENAIPKRLGDNLVSSSGRLLPPALFERPPEPSGLGEFIVSPLSPAFPNFPTLHSGSSEAASVQSSHTRTGPSHRSFSASDSQSANGSLPVPEPLPRHERTYSGILSHHDNKVKLQKSQPHGLLPSMIPHVRSLVLTAFPNQSLTNDTATNFISFISSCAEEETWSNMQSKMGYEFPPGIQKTAQDERMYAKSLFALSHVVLEVSNQKYGTNIVPSMLPRLSKSSVEDPDCEAFWTAASDDYSFFGSTGEEECGVPEMETVRTVPLEVRLGKMVVGEAEAGHQNTVHESAPPRQGQYDVLDEVSKFRRSKKIAYQNAIMRGDQDPHINGYWSGDIVVMR